MLDKSHHRVISGVVLILVCLWPATVNANMGIPFLFYVLWGYWVMLISVIIVEAIVISKQLSLSCLMATVVSTFVNIASALLGSVVLIAAEFAFSLAGFEAYYGWRAKIPFFVVLVPSYFISVWLEVLIARPLVTVWPYRKRWLYRDLTKVFYVANFYSYALLAFLGLVITLPPY